MKTVSRITAKEAGKYHNAIVNITIEMKHENLTRDEATKAKRYMEDAIVEQLLKDTFSANIKIKAWANLLDAVVINFLAEGGINARI